MVDALAVVTDLASSWRAAGDPGPLGSPIVDGKKIERGRGCEA